MKCKDQVGLQWSNLLTSTKDSHLDLPFWIAESLALHGFVDLSFPTMFQGPVLDQLRASPMIHLSQQSPFFFRFASLMIQQMYVFCICTTFFIDTFCLFFIDTFFKSFKMI